MFVSDLDDLQFICFIKLVSFMSEHSEEGQRLLNEFSLIKIAS